MCTEMIGLRIFSGEIAIEFNVRDQEKMIPGLGIGETKTNKILTILYTHKIIQINLSHQRDL